MERVAVLVADYMNIVAEYSHQRWADQCLDGDGDYPSMRLAAAATAAVFATVREMDPLAHDFTYDCIRATYLANVAEDEEAEPGSWRTHVSSILGRRIWEMAAEAVRRWNPALDPFALADNSWKPLPMPRRAPARGTVRYPEALIEVGRRAARFGGVSVDGRELEELAQLAIWSCGAPESDIERLATEIRVSPHSLAASRLAGWVSLASSVPGTPADVAVQALLDPPHPWEELLGFSHQEALEASVVFLDDRKLALEAALCQTSNHVIHATVGMAEDDPHLGDFPGRILPSRLSSCEDGLRLPGRMLRYPYEVTVVEFREGCPEGAMVDAAAVFPRSLMGGATVLFVRAPEAVVSAVVAGDQAFRTSYFSDSHEFAVHDLRTKFPGRESRLHGPNRSALRVSWNWPGRQ